MVFEVSLWDGMNNSRVFIQHRITYLFLLALLALTLKSHACLTFHLSLLQLQFIWLSVYSSLLTQTQSPLIVHRVRLPLEPRGGARVSVFTLIHSVYLEVASNRGKSHVARIVESNRTHGGNPGRVCIWRVVKCNDKQSVMRCVSPMHSKGLSALKPGIGVLKKLDYIFSKVKSWIYQQPKALFNIFPSVSLCLMSHLI